MRFKAVRELVRRELTVQAAAAATGELEVLNVPAIMGPPGMGKTSICHLFAEELNLRLLVINCGETSDTTDVSGMPGARFEPLKFADIIPYTEWQLNAAAARACVEPCLLLFDDIDKAPPAVQGALLGITGARTFRDYALHEGTLIMLAGNRVGDDMLSNVLSESLRSRVTIYELSESLEDFSAYAESTKHIHPMIIGYLHYAPKHLHVMDPKTMQVVSPRGWRQASRHMFAFPDPMAKIPDVDQPNWHAIITAKCGTAIGNDFWGWYQVLSKVDVPSILNGTKVTQVTGEAKDVRMWQFAAVFAVASHLNAKGVRPADVGLQTFVDELKDEMKVALLIQMSSSSRNAFVKNFPSAAASVMKTLTSVSV